MNAPERLERERADVLDLMRTPAGAAARQSAAEELLERGRALAERIERSGVLVDHATTGGSD